MQRLVQVTIQAVIEDDSKDEVEEVVSDIIELADWDVYSYTLRDCEEKEEQNKTKTKPIDKIRTEIENLEEGITSYHNDRPWVYKDEVLQIIDKYRTEIERKKDDNRRRNHIW